ncbi:S1C family serine protease [Ruegeria sp. PrR005]|uniref:Serine protease n=1 Tax=Ruegeria sp. PrR005 TaxID=2706882 RepID=A0A6B2NW84_9RHOB|nr:S1C family serine protease [Ruegeria sp. PrR005]NDW46689.1 serine protease [Ruegeria sp. PrR005]
MLKFLKIFCASMIASALAFSVAAKEPECTFSATEVYERIADNIVKIISFSIDQHRVLERVRPGIGSGIEIEPGLILTNYHVVQGAKLIGASTNDWAFEAQFLGGDPVLDLALLRVPFYERNFVAPEFGAYNDLDVGQRAYVLGYPLGVGLTLSEGLVSGLDRQIPLNTLSWTTRYIQTDAAVSPGSSGGALLDDCGRIIGLVSMISSHPQAENMGYALPIDSIMPLVGEIEEKGYVSRPWHGLYGQMMTPLIATLLLTDPASVPEGFMVETVEPGSAAEKIGIKGGFLPVMWGFSEILIGGDVITHVNGQPIRSREDALKTVGALEVGDVISLTVWRDGVSLELQAELEERRNFESDLWVNGQR